jgi:hypothetical protein
MEFDPAGPFNTFQPTAPVEAEGPKTPAETEQSISAHTPGFMDVIGQGTGRPGFEDDRSLSDFSNALDSWVAKGLKEEMERYGGIASAIGDSFSRMGGSVIEGVGNYFDDSASMGEQTAFIGSGDQRPNTQEFLQRKARKSQIIDRRLRKKAEERRRLGL